MVGQVSSPNQELWVLIMSNEEKVLAAGTADPFDQTKYAFAVPAGANKFGWTTCPTCGKPPTDTGQSGWGLVFQFRDRLSAREYGISGMCQECQDGTFGDSEDDDE